MGSFKSIFFVFICLMILPGSLLSTRVRAETQGGKRDKMTVSITTHLGDRQTFQKGDPLSFLLSLNRDAYLLLIYENAAGKLLQVLPNPFEGQRLYRAGLFMPFPDRTASFRFKIDAPFGKETLWAFASDLPFPRLEGKPLKNGFKLLTSELSVIRTQIRSAQVGAFGEAALSIFSKPRD